MTPATRMYLPMVAIVLSNLIYHLSQKSISGQVSYAASLTVTYLVSVALSVGLLLFSVPVRELGTALQSVGWASYCLAFGVVGIEAGFLLAYRFGWPISSAALYANAALTLLLVPVGVVWFQERLTWMTFLGIVLSLAGMILMTLK